MKWFTGKDDYLAAKQLLVELQETAYGIHDYRQSTHPFATALMRDNAKFMDHYLYDAYLDSYMMRDVFKYTGIPFDDFLNRPRYKIDKILQAVDRHRKKESSTTDDVLKHLKSQHEI
ncbi:MAG: hypothetical protein PHN51_12075 [Candidatus Nanopelagicales bacterium]|nr:hypothetical protein [Candidatus Nanopelagicales bacterium]